MISISWHPLAKEELFEASGFYDSESKGLGDIFLDAVQNALERLKLFPRAGNRILGETRWYLVPRFPYSIVYRVEENQGREVLFILALANQKKRPRYWAKRV